MNYDKLIQHYMEEALLSNLAKVASSAVKTGTRIGAKSLQNQNKTVFDTLNASSPYDYKDKKKNPDINSLKVGNTILVQYNDPNRDARGRIVKNPQSFIVKLKITTEPKNYRFQAKILDRKNFYSRIVTVSGLSHSKIERFAATPPKVAPNFIVDIGEGTLYEIYRKE
jgi:hypothetical protein